MKDEEIWSFNQHLFGIKHSKNQENTSKYKIFRHVSMVTASQNLVKMCAHGTGRGVECSVLDEGSCPYGLLYGCKVISCPRTSTFCTLCTQPTSQYGCSCVAHIFSLNRIHIIFIGLIIGIQFIGIQLQAYNLQALQLVL